MLEKREGAQSRGDCCEKNDEQEAGNGGELEFRLHLTHIYRKRCYARASIECQSKNMAKHEAWVENRVSRSTETECKITISFVDR